MLRTRDIYLVGFRFKRCVHYVHYLLLLSLVSYRRGPFNLIKMIKFQDKIAKCSRVNGRLHIEFSCSRNAHQNTIHLPEVDLHSPLIRKMNTVNALPKDSKPCCIGYQIFESEFHDLSWLNTVQTWLEVCAAMAATSAAHRNVINRIQPKQWHIYNFISTEWHRLAQSSHRQRHAPATVNSYTRANRTRKTHTKNTYCKL